MSDLVVRNNSGALANIDPKQVEILKKTLFKKFSADEIEFSLAVCARTGLDPFSKQVHFRKQKTKDDESICIITGIDGFRLIANRSGAYAGSDEPAFDNDEKPTKATATVYKIVQGQRVPFTASARWAEFYPGDAQGFMWRKMPFTMLGKCAEAQALRKAFPAELSNVYSQEEMHQARNERELLPTKAAEVNKILHETQETEQEFVTEAASSPLSEAPDLGDFVIQIGKKYKGMKLKDVEPELLASFVNWCEDNIEQKNDATAEFIETASTYLKAVERG